MSNEPDNEVQEENSDYDSADPEVPFPIHQSDAQTQENDSHKERDPTGYFAHPSHYGVRRAIHWFWVNTPKQSTFWTGLATVVMAVVTGMYTCYARRQWKAVSDEIPEVRRSADAAKSAAEIAASTLKEAQKTSMIEQRPYLVPANPSWVVPGVVPNVPLRANYFFVNTGKSPALASHAQAKLFKAKSMPFPYPAVESAFREMNKAVVKDQQTTRLHPEARRDIAPNQKPSYTTNTETLILTQKESELIFDETNPGMLIFFVGMVVYSDVYGNDYESDGCWFFYGKDQTNWHICDVHNIVK